MTCYKCTPLACKRHHFEEKRAVVCPLFFKSPLYRIVENFGEALFDSDGPQKAMGPEMAFGFAELSS